MQGFKFKTTNLYSRGYGHYAIYDKKKKLVGFFQTFLINKWNQKTDHTHNEKLFSDCGLAR